MKNQNRTDWRACIENVVFETVDEAEGELRWRAGGDTFTLSFAPYLATANMAASPVAGDEALMLELRTASSGSIAVSVDGRGVLEVEASPKIEGWELTSQNRGFIAVCAVGGDVSVFSPASDGLGLPQSD